MNETTVISTASELSRTHLVLTWTWIVAGFISGTLLGLKFHREDWLGGYSSHTRRLYRLGHISFFGLALMNFVFAITVGSVSASTELIRFASLGFVVGTITMPVCCVVVAHRVQWRSIFAVPVVSLVGASTITLLEIVRL